MCTRAPALARMPYPAASVTSFCSTSTSLVPAVRLIPREPGRRMVKPTMESHERPVALMPNGRTDTHVWCEPGESPPRFTYRPLPEAYDQCPLGKEAGGRESGTRRVPSTNTCPGFPLTP